jgi:hypothetical protein
MHHEQPPHRRRPFRFGVLGEQIRSGEGLLAEAHRAEALGYATLLLRDRFMREPFGDQLVGRPVGVAGHKLVQQGAAWLGDPGVQQRGRRHHQHTAGALVAGWVQEQAEVAVRHAAGFQGLTVGVSTELPHRPGSSCWRFQHQGYRVAALRW